MRVVSTENIESLSLALETLVVIRSIQAIHIRKALRSNSESSSLDLIIFRCEEPSQI